jgi:hypothetical protein
MGQGTKMNTPKINPEVQLPQGMYSDQAPKPMPMPPKEQPPAIGLASALARAQGQMENAGFDAVNPHFRSKYATLAAYINAIKKALSNNDIAYAQIMDCERDADGFERYYLITILEHGASREKMQSKYPVPNPVNIKPHEMGSFLTYARRYSLAAITGQSADEDDDANAAQKATVNGGSKARITPEQVQTFEDMIKNHAKDRDKYLGYISKLYNERITQLGDIPADKYDDALETLIAGGKKK